MRPYPREVSLETPFEICWHYRRGEKCGQSCTFAHGEEELTTWTTQRQSGFVCLFIVPRIGLIFEILINALA